MRGACCAVRYPDRIVIPSRCGECGCTVQFWESWSGSAAAPLFRRIASTSAPAAGGCEGWVLRVASRENAAVSPGTPARFIGDTYLVSSYFSEAAFAS